MELLMYGALLFLFNLAFMFLSMDIIEAYMRDRVVLKVGVGLAILSLGLGYLCWYKILVILFT